ncbi:MAG: lipid-A-disaccharide synthase N-terminal domain-containing protein [Lysobacteraceae bacterium]
MNDVLTWLQWTGIHITMWKLIGYAGALMFSARWFVQLHASRRAGRPETPRAFWYMSVVGSLMTLSYFVFSPKSDSVGVIGNLFPAFIASYNLYLDIRHRGWKPHSDAPT